ncbi:MAG: ATP-binding protein [Calditrichota bacterium]
MKKRYYLSMLSMLPLLWAVNMVYLVAHQSVLVFFQLVGILTILFGLGSYLGARWIYRPIAQLFEEQGDIEVAKKRISQLTLLSTLWILLMGLLYNFITMLPLFIDPSVYGDIETFQVNKMPLGFLLLGIPPTIYVFAVLPSFITSLVVGDFALDLRKAVHEKYGILYPAGTSKIRIKMIAVLIILILIPALLTTLELFVAREYQNFSQHFSSLNPLESVMIDRFAIFLGVVVSILVLARSLTKPLDFLLEKIAAVQKGDFSVRTAVSTSDEFSIVTSEFNSMLDKLETSRNELREANHTLEQKVASRTEELSVKNSQLEETLQQVQEMQQQIILQEKLAGLGQLVAGVTHEINSPISAMRSISQTKVRAMEKLQAALNNGQSDPAVIERMLKAITQADTVIANGTERLEEIVSSLKNFARLDEAEKVEADIHEGINSALTLLDGNLLDKIDVVRKFGDLPLYVSDARKLNQVFYNILKNAAEAIDGAGTIEIITQNEGEKIRLIFKDSGRGITTEQLQTLFTPGFSRKQSTVRASLSLPTSYRIVQEHGGTITVQSKPGEGSTFTIHLPGSAE